MAKRTAKDLMTTDVLVVEESVAVHKAIELMQSKNVGSILVVDKDESLQGIFTERDVLRFSLKKDFLKSPIRQYMTKNPLSISKDMCLAELHCEFDAQRFRHFPVLDKGRVVGIISIRDLIKHWSDIFDAKNKALFSKCSQAMADVVHDLRSPLNAIKTINEMLATNDISITEFLDNEYPRVISRSCDVMSSLINELLDLTSIAGNELRLNKAEINLVEVLEDVVTTFLPVAHSKNIAVDFEAEACALFYADRLRVTQIFHNLISNSIKYSSPSSSIKVSLQTDGDGVKVQFIDYGQGIRKDELSRVFNQLCKISSKPTANETSTGLGLSITKRLVEAHQGEIRVESEPNKRTCFTVYFPHPQKKYFAA